MEAKGEREVIRGLLGQIGIANAKVAYERFEERFRSPRFAALERAGARLQRPLWASSSTKDPKYPDVYYVHHLIAPDSVNSGCARHVGGVPRPRRARGPGSTTACWRRSPKSRPAGDAKPPRPDRGCDSLQHAGLTDRAPGGEALGDFPQAFTHLALISAAFNLEQTLGARGA